MTDIEGSDLGSFQSIIEQFRQKKISRQEAEALLNDLKQRAREPEKLTGKPEEIFREHPPLSFPETTEAKKTESCIQAGDIAVVGMTGQFPDARNVDIFWKNLETGHNAMGILPEKYLKSDTLNGDYYRWGGILEGRECFDPLFFNITPREAKSMNPHQRLILEESWKALEDAGYNPRSFAGSRLSIFIGAEPTGYYFESFTGFSDAIIATRLSYFLNLHGPAMVVNTGCSSSGVAIHLACESLRNKESEIALAGGVFGAMDQASLMMMAKVGMLSPTGRCRTFDESGDGTVISEGVGMVALKRLEDAIADHDNIYGVICGSGVNQDGASNGITAPSGIAQALLISGIYNRFNINPEEITYVEAHGTGTRLGDPVEGNALVHAFRHFTDKRGFCAVGSAKSHIGHTGAAAGVTSLIKVLLSMKHAKIPGLINFDKLNPLIEFEDSPFYVNTRTVNWERRGDKPHTAAINSFGHSGTNVHLVVKEYLPQNRAYTHNFIRKEQNISYLIPLSAKTEEALLAQAENLLRFLKTETGEADCIEGGYPRVNKGKGKSQRAEDCIEADYPLIKQVAYTLQTGREQMKHRMIFLVRDISMLIEKLALVCKGNDSKVEELWLSSNKSTRELQNEQHLSHIFQNPATLENLRKIARIWANGSFVDFSQLYSGKRPKKISLPTYPFARERYWIPESASNSLTSNRPDFATSVLTGSDIIHPLVHKNTSTFKDQQFCSRFTGEEFFLTDHKIKGVQVLPGMAYLEMAREAIQLSADPEYKKPQTITLKNIIWARPIALSLDLKPVEVNIRLTENDHEQIEFEIYTHPETMETGHGYAENIDQYGDKTKHSNQNNQNQEKREKNSPTLVHSRGVALLESYPDETRIDIHALKKSCSLKSVSKKECYDFFRSMGIEYGPAHRGIDTLYLGSDQVVAKLELSEEVFGTDKSYILHPGLMDSAIQASMGLMMAQKKDASGENSSFSMKPALPFALDEISILRPCKRSMWAWIRHGIKSRTLKKIEKLDIDLCDMDGTPVARIRGFSARTSDEKNFAEKTAAPEDDLQDSSSMLMLEPFFEEKESFKNLTATSVAEGFTQHWVFLCAPENISSEDIENQIKGATGYSANQIKGAAENIENRIKGARCRVLTCRGVNLEEQFTSLTLQMFEHIKQMLEKKPTGNLLVQVVIFRHEYNTLFTGISGMLKTAAIENPKFAGQVILMDLATDAQYLNLSPDELLISRLSENKNNSSDSMIQYWNNRRRVQKIREIDPFLHTPLIPWKDRGVYLITGGCGGLGLIFAGEIVSQTKNTTLVLTGRSPLDQGVKTRLDTISTSFTGARVEYHQVDMADNAAVSGLISHIVDNFDTLDGIIHSAGVIKDNFIIKKDIFELEQVLSPKVSGVAVLDLATRDLNLNFFIMFSSIAGFAGGSGQADYAAANAFMDKYAEYRESLRQQHKRHGRTISINWPLWQEGGMGIDVTAEKIMARMTGIRAMQTRTGIDAFYRTLALDKPNVLVMAGDLPKIRQYLSLSKQNSEAISESIEDRLPLEKTMSHEELTRAVLMLLAQRAAKALDVPAEDVEPDAHFIDYGFDPVMFSMLITDLNAQFHTDLTMDLYSKCPGLNLLARYLTNLYEDLFLEFFHAGLTTLHDDLAKDQHEPVQKENLLEGDQFREHALVHIQTRIASVIDIHPDRLDPDAAMEEYGIDSIMAMELTLELEKGFGSLPKTLFFEYLNIRDLTGYFFREHHEKLVQILVQKIAAIKPEEAPSSPPVFTIEHEDNPSPARHHKAASADHLSVQISPENSTSANAYDLSGRSLRPVGLPLPMKPDHEISDIAIIGLAGRYAKSSTIDQFWENLKAGADCITPIPQERWDHSLFFDADKDKPGKTYARWGGFIDDADKFDPLFFNISPQEAIFRDPQERLFLECIQETLEDAGYTRDTLKGLNYRSEIGVYVGVMYEEYQLYGAQEQVMGNPYVLSGSQASIANRVSYFYDFNGPSMAVDTMCSSSLTAIHLACQSLRQQECAMALAGGVNLSIHPNKFLMLGQGKLASSDGRCRSFGEGGDGYVPGEGVGAVLLKPLVRAIEDDDHIYGVIRGSAINHGGKTNGYSVPNPKAQAEVISRALKNANVHPRTISFLETHGTGTALGDPIEIAGLTRAFREQTRERQFCAIGSAKSNIGHCEGAAGIAGLTKVLLQMKHGLIVPSLHSEKLNPNINFEDSPFMVQQKTALWKRPVINLDNETREYPRIAGLSSFGAGGGNAHLIIEEYSDQREIFPEKPSEKNPAIILVSARKEDALVRQVTRLTRFIQKHSLTDADLYDMAYTLQKGREHYSYRVAFTAASMAEVVENLEAFSTASGRAEMDGKIFRGKVPRKDSSILMMDSDDDMAKTIKAWIGKRKYDRILALWVQGFYVDWNLLYPDIKPRRISLPAYPFEKNRYWIGEKSFQVPTLPEKQSVTIPHTPVSRAVYETILFTPAWKNSPVYPDSSAARQVPQVPAFARHIVVLWDMADIWPLPPDSSYISSSKMEIVRLNPESDRVETNYHNLALKIFQKIKKIISQKEPGKTLIQVLIPSGSQNFPFTGISALLKSAAIENPNITGQVIELSPGTNRDELVLKLYGNASRPQESHIRYQNGERLVAGWQKIEGAPAAVPEKSILKDHGTYLITGGAGGLGLIFAKEILSRVSYANIILTGRSDPDENKKIQLKNLQSNRGTVRYLKADVSDQQSVSNLIQDICAEFKSLNGIIHSAGIIADNFILKKTSHEFTRVLGPKVNGVCYLDQATKDMRLDFFVFFSSGSGVMGNTGQADYAAANAFMDGYALYRNTLVKKAERYGRTLSINWPLWENGGMQVADETRGLMMLHTGTVPMKTRSGITAFYQGLGLNEDQVMVLEGEAKKIEALLSGGLATVKEPLNQPRTQIEEAGPGASDIKSREKNLVLFLKESLSRVIRLPSDQIETDVPFDEYGIDSIMVMNFISLLEERFGSLSKTLVFEYENIQELTRYFMDSHGAATVKLFNTGLPPKGKIAEPVKEPAPSREVATNEKSIFPQFFNPDHEPESVSEPHPQPESGSELQPQSKSDTESQITEQIKQTNQETDIAVIGLSGRYPESENIDIFWENLKSGADCITRIPKERWDNSLFFDENRNKLGKIYTEWGGFLKDVDQFDPLFFEIPEREAEWTDPKERLFLEIVWNLFESAGYTRKKLDETCNGNVGVWVGSMYQQYPFAAPDAVKQSVLSVLASHSYIANRVSYFYDFQGPSMAIDTKCSSSLTAVHMACESLIKGECRMAVAGGVNLTLHPNKYLGMCNLNMISSDKNIRSFGDGDGFIPSEGVGAVLLKPLSAAIKDNDQILSVIKSSIINHGGKTKGFTNPDPKSHMRLITDNLKKSGIDPRTITYVESSATGSAPSDIIEISSMSKAFRQYTRDLQFCAIGSVKSNIGHAEAASGISQLTKVILQLHHKKLVPTIKADPLNPDIRFESTPFFMQQTLGEWIKPVIEVNGKSKTIPRRAAVNSFGVGGSNAHLILEEYVPDTKDNTDTQESAGTPSTPSTQNNQSDLKDYSEDYLRKIMVFSARNRDQLNKVLEQMIEFVNSKDELSLSDMAYTLQTSRETMESRAAMVVRTRQELVMAMKHFIRRNRITREELSSGKNHLSIEIEDDALSIPVFTGEEKIQVQAVISGNNRKDDKADPIKVNGENPEKTASLWAQGYTVAWEEFHQGKGRQIMALPSYPFAKKRYWIDPDMGQDATVPPYTPDSAQATKDNIAFYLKNLVSHWCKKPLPEISGNTGCWSLSSDQWFCLKLMRLIEEQLFLKITEQEMQEHDTIDSLARLLAQKTDITTLQNGKIQTAGLRYQKDQIDQAGLTYKTGSTELTDLTDKGKGASEDPITSTDHFPLSEGQKGLWLLQKLDPKMSAYNLPVAYRLKERLDTELFFKACNHTFTSHPIFNTVIVEEKGVPFQRFETQKEICFRQWMIADLEEEEILSLIKEKAREPFDLEKGPLIRFHLFSASGKDDVILILIHHIIIDGVSLLLFLKTLWSAYADYRNSRSPLLTMPETGYRDFVIWERNMLQSSAGQHHLEYWKKNLSGDLPLLSIPADFPENLQNSAKSEVYELCLYPELTLKVMQFCRSRRINPSIFFLGIFKVLIYRYTSQTDIIVGMPTMGRPEPRFEEVIGYFINMVAFRSKINGDTLFTDLLKTLRSTMFEGLAHAVFPFPALVRELKVPRYADLSPIFQVAYTYQNYMQLSGNQITDKVLSSDSGNIKVLMEQLHGLHQESDNDLGLEIIEQEDRFEINMEYNPGRFKLSTIKQMTGHYINLLESVLIDPQRAVAMLPMLNSSETMELVSAFNTHDRYNETWPIHEVIRQQAKKSPLSVAVESQGQGNSAVVSKMTYKELQDSVNDIFNHMVSNGVVTGDKVAVCLERSIKIVPAILAIFRAGGVYVPIDPDFPDSRICHIIEDTKAGMLLLHDTTLEKLEIVTNNPDIKNSHIKYLNLDRLEKHALKTKETDKRRDTPFSMDSPAYIIYTSGSTGTPKGVVVSHRAIANHCAAIRACYAIAPEDTILQFASFGVDTSIEQILPGLAAGARIWIKDKTLWPPKEFSRNIITNDITIIDIPPLYLHELLLYWCLLPESAPQGVLKLVVVGGEEIMPETVRLWQQSPMSKKRLINAYGPTETTITSTIFEIDGQSCEISGSGRIPLGRALGNRDTYILDRDSNLVPPGVSGELHIGGEIASGYLNLPDQTKEKFIPDPFADKSGSRICYLYRTGDLARIIPGTNGLIEFLGRMDHQINIRGFRIEPEEIETKLNSHKMVARSLVLTHGKESKDKELVAYIEADNGYPDHGELKAFLAETLPFYMVPNSYVIMDRFPLLPGGKINRFALPDPSGTKKTVHKEFITPKDKLELDLSRIWCKILAIPKVGICDDFFDLGGHSILLVRLTAEISHAFGIDLSISAIISNPTVQMQAILIRTRQGDLAKKAQGVAVLMQPRGNLSPFFCIHPSGGNILCYIRLARLMGEDRPFYGLQSPGISGEKMPDSLEEMAAIYIDAIKRTQPKGPYYIGGWSLGGVVAYEVAHQLRRAGEKIACLALIESSTPDAARDLEKLYLKQDQVNDLDRDLLIIRSFILDLNGSFDQKILDALDLATLEYSADKISESLVKMVPEEENLFNVIMERVQQREEIPNSDAELLKQLFTVFKNNIQAMDRYMPVPVENIPVTLIRASGNNDNNINKESANGWKKLAGENLQTEMVEGDHYSILKPPAVQHLATILKQVLATD